MPKVYIIAGPPGIGKSTSGGSTIPAGINILDPDQIANRYKTQGFADYKDIGNLKFNDILRKELFSGADFAIELNLGFENHYDLVKSVKNFNTDNSIEVVLFYTDDIELCYKRAELRHLAGLHYVGPDVIKEMYENTIPLLYHHFNLVSSLTVLDVKENNLPEICLQFNRLNKELLTSNDLPSWAETSIRDFIRKQYSHGQSLKVEQVKKSKRMKNRPKF